MPSDPSARPDCDQLVETAHQIRIACLRVARRSRYDTSQELTPQEFTALAWIEGGPMTAGAIAHEEQVSAPTMSRIVKELEARDLLSRCASCTDRRQLDLTITELGRAALARSRAARDAWMVRRLEQLDRDQLEVVARAAAILNQVAHK